MDFGAFRLGLWFRVLRFESSICFKRVCLKQMHVFTVGFGLGREVIERGAGGPSGRSKWGCKQLSQGYRKT